MAKAITSEAADLSVGYVVIERFMVVRLRYLNRNWRTPMPEADRWWCHEHGWVERDHGTITCNCSCLWIPGVSVEKINAEEREACSGIVASAYNEAVTRRVEALNKNEDANAELWNAVAYCLSTVESDIRARGQHPEEGKDE